MSSRYQCLEKSPTMFSKPEEVADGSPWELLQMYPATRTCPKRVLEGPSTFPFPSPLSRKISRTATLRPKNFRFDPRRRVTLCGKFDFLGRRRIYYISAGRSPSEKPHHNWPTPISLSVGTRTIISALKIVYPREDLRRKITSFPRQFPSSVDLQTIVIKISDFDLDIRVLRCNLFLSYL